MSQTRHVFCRSESTTTTAESCLQLQVLGSIQCGCHPYPHPDVTCILCPTLPEQEVLDKVVLQEGDINVTCALAILAAALASDEDECSLLINAYAPACQCPE